MGECRPADIDSNSLPLTLSLCMCWKQRSYGRLASWRAISRRIACSLPRWRRVAACSGVSCASPAPVPVCRLLQRQPPRKRSKRRQWQRTRRCRKVTSGLRAAQTESGKSNRNGTNDTKNRRAATKDFRGFGLCMRACEGRREFERTRVDCALSSPGGSRYPYI
jgi:hypothetical protein